MRLCLTYIAVLKTQLLRYLFNSIFCLLKPMNVVFVFLCRSTPVSSTFNNFSMCCFNSGWRRDWSSTKKERWLVEGQSSRTRLDWCVWSRLIVLKTRSDPELSKVCYQVCQIRVMTEFETITLTQDGAVDFKTIAVFLFPKILSTTVFFFRSPRNKLIYQQGRIHGYRSLVQAQVGRGHIWGL